MIYFCNPKPECALSIKYVSLKAKEAQHVQYCFLIFLLQTPINTSVQANRSVEAGLLIFGRDACNGLLFAPRRPLSFSWRHLSFTDKHRQSELNAGNLVGLFL